MSRFLHGNSARWGLWLKGVGVRGPRWNGFDGHRFQGWPLKSGLRVQFEVPGLHVRTLLVLQANGKPIWALGPKSLASEAGDPQCPPASAKTANLVTIRSCRLGPGSGSPHVVCAWGYACKVSAVKNCSPESKIPNSSACAVQGLGLWLKLGFEQQSFRLCQCRCMPCFHKLERERDN